jgi:hypothetical protein
VEELATTSADEAGVDPYAAARDAGPIGSALRFFCASSLFVGGAASRTKSTRWM